jgi:hypothetical protein
MTPAGPSWVRSRGQVVRKSHTWNAPNLIAPRGECLPTSAHSLRLF